MLSRRLQNLGILIVGVSGVVFILLAILRENIVFFITPTEYKTHQLDPYAKPNRTVRLGGKVLPNSIQKKEGSLLFILTDGQESVAVVYQGVIPSLFCEGQGVVVEGKPGVDHQTFIASKVFAKHDEYYIPADSKVKK